MWNVGIAQVECQLKSFILFHLNRIEWNPSNSGLPLMTIESGIDRLRDWYIDETRKFFQKLMKQLESIHKNMYMHILAIWAKGQHNQENCMVPIVRYVSNLSLEKGISRVC